jgi:hypothetical protein
MGVLGDVQLGDTTRLVLGGVHLPEQRESRNGASALFGITWLNLGVCHDFVRNDAWAFSTCASALIGTFHVVAVQPAPVDVGERLWAAGALGLRAEWLGAAPTSLRTGLELVVPVDRRTNSVEWNEPARREDLFTEPALGAIGFVGLGVQL